MWTGLSSHYLIQLYAFGFLYAVVSSIHRNYSGAHSTMDTLEWINPLESFFSLCINVENIQVETDSSGIYIPSSASLLN